MSALMNMLLLIYTNKHDPLYVQLKLKIILLLIFSASYIAVG